MKLWTFSKILISWLQMINRIAIVFFMVFVGHFVLFSQTNNLKGITLWKIKLMNN